MAVQKILPVQNPILRQTSKPVTTFDRKVERIIADLSDTLKIQKDPVGVGLASPQVGKNVRLFIIKSGKNIIPFINPEIIWKSKETNDPKPKNRQPRTEKLTSDNRRLKTDTLSAQSGRHLAPEYIMEGCLSLPYYYGPVRRSAAIKVKYQTPELVSGVWQMVYREKTLKGLPAQIVQHEVDHLNGILFVDRLLEQKRKLYQWKDGEWSEVELP